MISNKQCFKLNFLEKNNNDNKESKSVVRQCSFIVLGIFDKTNCIF